MGELVLHSQFESAADPASAYCSFGSGDPTLGWLFGSEADGLRLGTLVRLVVPLSGFGGLDGTARIVELVPYKRITLIHESPWSGRVVCRFRPRPGGGSRVRVEVSLDEDEIQRLAVEIGLARPAEPPASGVALGLLTSLSGPCGLYGRSTVNCAELAVAEINADGGVRGRPVSLNVADDGTSAAVGTVAMRRLLGMQRLDAVIGMTTSPVRDAAARVAIGAGVPFLFAPLTEPTREHPLLLRLGETPSDQLTAALPRLAEETGGKRWFIAGNDYSWPRAVASTARATIESIGGSIVGEGFVPLGSVDFEQLVTAIERSEADHVIAALVGQDHVRFEQQFVRRGLRQSTRTFAPLLDDAVLEHLGGGDGIWNAMAYFEDLDTVENREFLARYRERYGEHAPRVSTAAESVYETVHRWARAANRCSEDDAAGLVNTLRHTVYGGPRLRSDLSRPAQMLLGEAHGSGMRVLDRLPVARRAS